MAYRGYLIKLGNSSISTEKYIVASTYKVSKKIIDLDSYRDANGKLHRNALDHCSYVIEFEVKPMTNSRMENLMSEIRGSFTNPKERKLSLTFYLPELDSYETADFYMPDPDYPIERIEGNTVYYKQMSLKFIGY